jgi:adenylate cyclase
VVRDHLIGLAVNKKVTAVVKCYLKDFLEERKVLLFLDINGSTALAERLGALKMRALVRKFLSDLSQPIVDHGGVIYLYKGDGVIAIWNWADAVKADAILKAVDAMFAAIAREREAYAQAFGVAPTFRVGIHGGDVIVSEQGDAKRSIGIYGDAINIAADGGGGAGSRRPLRNLANLAAALSDRGRVHELGSEQVTGISAPIAICEYSPG